MATEKTDDKTTEKTDDKATREGPGGAEPSSHETCGQFPAQEVAETFPGGGGDPQAKTERSKAADQTKTTDKG